MTIEEYGDRLGNMIAELRAKRDQILTGVGMNAIQQIRSRIVETGKKASGSKFASPDNPSGYSRKPMLTNYTAFWKKSGHDLIAGSKAKRRELKWVTLKRGDRLIRLFVLRGGYEQFRQLQGRRIDIVNFSFTNTMWSSMRVKAKEGDTVTIGVTRQENIKKMEGLTKRFGKILELSKDEERKVRADMKKDVLEIVKRYGI